MSDRDTFGPRLRAERERRGISLDTIAAVTNVSADLWDGLERNDVSRWPSGIFARSFVRDYARAIGLDEAEVVNDFCRLFPNGDRRARRLIEAHAKIIGHKPKVDDQVGGLPLEGDRRAAPPSRRSRRRPSASAGAANRSNRPGHGGRARHGRRGVLRVADRVLRDCRRPCHPLLRRGHDDARLLGRHSWSWPRRQRMPSLFDAATGAELTHSFDSTAAVPQSRSLPIQLSTIRTFGAAWCPIFQAGFLKSCPDV
jgi:transcriptional regulator with XRE-family HTH domain